MSSYCNDCDLVIEDVFKSICPSCGKDLESKSALDIQLYGNHYKGFKIQPFEFFHANQLPFHKADIIKRIMRYDKPTGKGLQDLQKIIHEVEMIIELEGYKEGS